MRWTFGMAAVSAIVFLAPSTAGAQTRSQVQAFGGFTFGDTAPASTFGGNVAVPLTSSIQIIAEGGRLADLKPELLDTLLDFTPVNLQVSAWYGEAGVRFLVPSHSAVTPYVEATAGFARMQTGFDGLGGTTGAVIESALGFLDRTEPLLGVGGGVIVQGGPIVLDFGYRYKKIMADGPVQSLLNGGNAFDVSQARIGVGVRF